MPLVAACSRSRLEVRAVGGRRGGSMDARDPHLRALRMREAAAAALMGRAFTHVARQPVSACR